MYGWKEKSKVRLTDRLLPAILYAALDALVWVFAPLFLSSLAPLENLWAVLLAGVAISASIFVSKILEGTLFGMLAGVFSDSLKIFLIFAASGGGLFEVNYNGSHIVVNARPLLEILLLPFVVSAVGRVVKT